MASMVRKFDTNSKMGEAVELVGYYNSFLHYSMTMDILEHTSTKFGMESMNNQLDGKS
jgi:hypothetical protein